jgi:hypothetical protein
MKVKTPIKSIRAYCVECCCENRAEVRFCSSQNCPLWAYRMGKRPNTRESENEQENS